MIDLFIAHAWRFHPEWVKLSDAIENNFLESVRNFSLPWHDPAISPNSEYGKNFLDSQLKSQITPASFVILIDDLFKVESNLRWLFASMDFALIQNKNLVFVNGNTNICRHRPKFNVPGMQFGIDNFEIWISDLLQNSL